MRYLLLTSVITIAAMPSWAQGKKGSEETTKAGSQPTLRNAQSRVTTRPSRTPGGSVRTTSRPATPPTEPKAKTPTAPKELAIEDFSLVKLLQGDVTPSYGFSKSPVEIHAFLNAALWYLGEQSLGKYANEGGSLAGRPVFITYSGYIDVSCKLSSTVMAEAEFELYKGEKGEFKVTKLRGVWAPNKYFKLSLGRDFPPIGVQDKVYYPTSQFRFIALSPYLYWSILRATGWWDAGIHMSGTLPLKGINGYLRLDFSVINGPGEQHHSEANYLTGLMKPNAQGYMYENFHSKARQPWDNNVSKFFPVRLSFSPMRNLELGASWMQGFYDDNDEYLARYIFGHLLYSGERLTIAAEYGMLQIEVDQANMREQVNRDNGTFDDGWVTQYSFYVSAGYKLFKGRLINFVEPLFRFEVMDSWLEDQQNRGMRYMAWLGIRFSPIKHWVIKVAAALQWEPYGDEISNNAFIAETVFDF